MRPARSLTRLVALLVVVTPFAPLYSQPRSPKPARQFAAAADPVAELLEMTALPPGAEESSIEPDEFKVMGMVRRDGEEKPPKDGAPIEELIEYWSGFEAGAKTPEPSPATRRRLLEACERRPDLLPPLLGFLPAGADTHDRLLRLLNEDPEDDGGWKEDTRDWLRWNSGYFRDELIAAAREARDGDEGGDADVYGRADLEALARLDPAAARPILETFAASPMPETSTFALTLLYAQACKDGAAAQEGYRARLKSIVADAQAPYGAREGACMSLAATEWDGRNEWFLSLFTLQRQALPLPPALMEKLTRPLTLEEIKRLPPDVSDMILRARGRKEDSEAALLFEPPPIILLNDPGKFTPLVSRLVGDRNRATHEAAVRYLLACVAEGRMEREARKKVVQLLLPWLTDANWSAVEGRTSFISSLSDVEMPEIIPDLIRVLDYDEDSGARAAAATALTQYRDARAVPALKRALARENAEVGRGHIVTALAQCGGLSDAEIAAAIEAYAEYAVTLTDEEEWRSLLHVNVPATPLPLDVSIGLTLDRSDEIAATEGLAVRLLDRVKELKRSRPAVAARILKVIERSPLHVVNLDLVRRIGANEADADVITFALDIRDDLNKSVGDEMRALLKQGGQASGIAAVLLKDEGVQLDILRGADVPARRALLACARLAFDKLPVEVVAKLLDGPPPLALAAERYLESEDSAEARRVLYARRPNEALILGAQVGFDPRRSGFPKLNEWEEALRREVRGVTRGQDAPDEVYALVSAENPQQHAIIIRVRGRRAEIVVRQDTARGLVRPLTDAEFQELRDFTSRPEVEDLPSAFTSRGANPTEYLRLTRAGGRRVFTHWPRRTPKGATPHEQLSGFFYRLSKSGEFRLRYELEAKVAGLEVLLADEKFHALAVGQERGEIRVLAQNVAEAARKRDWTGDVEWRVLGADGLGEVTAAPAAFPAENLAALPEGMQVRPHHGAPWYARAGDVTVVWGEWSGERGLWKIARGGSPIKLLGGTFINPVLTPDAGWLAAVQIGEGGTGLLRVNLATGRSHKVALTAGKLALPLTFVAAHGRVLLKIGGGAPDGAGEYALLDAATGGVLPVKGEFGPLRDQAQRPLQPAGRPHEFWAAIHDAKKNATAFGRYDAKSFAFTPVIELPEIQANSRETWVDAAAGKLYVVYRGHLLRLPLPQ
jgi:hypothetical protein